MKPFGKGFILKIMVSPSFLQQASIGSSWSSWARRDSLKSMIVSPAISQVYLYSQGLLILMSFGHNFWWKLCPKSTVISGTPLTATLTVKLVTDQLFILSQDSCLRGFKSNAWSKPKSFLKPIYRMTIILVKNPTWLLTVRTNSDLNSPLSFWNLKV
jgi:hypothetical protein